jgi:hypothetical protein
MADATDKVGVQEARGNVSRPATADEMLRREACRTGYWAAILAAALGLLVSLTTLLAAITAPPGGWNGTAAWAGNLDLLQFLPFVPSLLLAPVFLVLIVSLHYQAPALRKLWSHLAVAFATVYAALASINAWMQLTAVYRSAAHADIEALGMFSAANPSSFATALLLSSAFMGLAALCAIQVLGPGKLESWTRNLWLVAGLAGLLGTLGSGLAEPGLLLVGFWLPWTIAFPAGAITWAVLLRRTGQGA